MTNRSLLLALAAAAPLASCFPEKLVQPACTPVTITVASTNVDTVTTNTGLRYIEGTEGPGAFVEWCRNVLIHYEAYLLDGTKFDDSRAAGVPLLFTPGVGSIIEGLEEGVIQMRKGSKRRLIIPPSLGFGSEPRRDQNGTIIVPGNSTVVYDIEIIEVNQ